MTSPDAGGQNERTALAWQRTALSLMAASAAVSRLTFDRLGLLALLGLAVTFPLTLWVLLESRSRYRHHAGLLPRPRRRSGRAPVILAVAIGSMAITELVAMTLAR